MAKKFIKHTELVCHCIGLDVRYTTRYYNYYLKPKEFLKSNFTDALVCFEYQQRVPLLNCVNCDQVDEPGQTRRIIPKRPIIIPQCFVFKSFLDISEGAEHSY